MRRWHALCTIPTWSRTLNSAPPRRFLLCALLSWVKLRSAISLSHCIIDFSSIQCPVMAKYPFILVACHASQVIFIAPLTAALCVGKWDVMKQHAALDCNSHLMLSRVSSGDSWIFAWFQHGWLYDWGFWLRSLPMKWHQSCLGTLDGRGLG